MSSPTSAQIKAVQAVVRDHAQLRAMKEDIQQINLLMNLAGPPLPENDVRVAVGDGPEWRIPATGALDPAVLEAVSRCQDLAQRLESMSSALGKLDLPSGDRQALVTVLHELALVWTARATLWRNPKPPGDATSAAAAISAHQTASTAAAKKVQAYLVATTASNRRGS